MLLIYKIIATEVEFIFLGRVFNIIQTATVTTFFTLFNVSQLILKFTTIAACWLSGQGTLDTLLTILVLCTYNFPTQSL